MNENKTVTELTELNLQLELKLKRAQVCFWAMTVITVCVLITYILNVYTLSIPTPQPTPQLSAQLP